MTFINKILAIILFPIGILAILKNINVFSIDLGIDVVFIGAIVMFVLQAFTVFFLNKDQKKIKFMNMISFLVFAGASAVYIIIYLLGSSMSNPLQLILAVMMFIEGMYALN